VWTSETDVTRNRQAQHLANGIAHLLASLLAPRGAFAAGTLANPYHYERFDVSGEVSQFARAVRLRKLTEAHQDRNAVEHAARREPLLR
jgi:hypothetical protein